MTIRPFQLQDRDEILRMQRSLFPTYSADEFDAQWTRSGQMGSVTGTMFVLDRGGGKLGGFVEVSLRNVVDGCLSSPVGYLEAWYVDADLRRGGWGRQLVAAAEEWSGAEGCTEMGSDILIGNHASEEGHRAMGFLEVDRCINFRKPIVKASQEKSAEWIAITDAPLSVARCVEFVSDPAAGGIDVFLGTTRSETSPEGNALTALDYEAYEQMALDQMKNLANRAREKWPIVKLALLHRVGRVLVGDPSVIIAVSTPHRAESFEACRFLIDELKKDIAIWKKEVWSDGTGTWVHPDSAPSPSGRGPG